RDHRRVPPDVRARPLRRAPRRPDRPGRDHRGPAAPVPERAAAGPGGAGVTALVVSDAAFADADAVFAAATAHLAAKYAAIRPLTPDQLPDDRAAAIAALDAWAGDASWRAEVIRFYEASAPVLLRPDPGLNGLLRRARRAGRELTIVSPLPRAAVE